jgi:hypothetical protein
MVLMQLNKEKLDLVYTFDCLFTHPLSKATWYGVNGVVDYTAPNITSFKF